MKKSYFFKFFVFAVIAAFVTVTSCKDYDDDISNLEEKIAGLSTTVTELKGKVDGGAVITKVESTTTGLKITLSNGQTYDLTNGKDGVAGAKGDKGDTGAAGKPGSVVTANEDGFWYIDGKKSEYTWKGEKGEAGKDGVQGPIGPEGPAGKDGAYYYPHTDGFWHKVNGGDDVATTQTWLPEGTITAVFDETTGVVSLYNVKGAEGPVTLGKTPLAGLLFAPDTMEDGVGVIDLGYINGVLATKTVRSTFQTDLKLNFRFNPSSADISKTTWRYIANSVKFRSAPDKDVTDLFTVSGVTEKFGWGEFGLHVEKWVEPAAGEERVVALQGTSKEGEKTNVVTSDYVKVVSMEYLATISDAKKLTTPAFTDYRTTSPAISDANDHEDLLYTAKDVDLLDYVWATATPNKGGGIKKLFDVYGFTDYKFEFSTEVNFKGLDGITNQNAFVELNGSKLTVLQGTAAIDRTPLIKVTLKSSLNDAVLATGFIKFKIVKEAPVPATPKTYTFDGGSIPYAKLFKGETVIANNKTDIEVGWTKMNQIYTELGLSHNEFAAIYNVAPVTASPADQGKGSFVQSPNGPDVDSYAMKYQITPLAKFGKTTVTYTFKPTNTAYPELNMVFTYNIVKPTLDKTILAGYRYNDSPTAISTKGMNTGSGYLMQLYLGEAFAFGSNTYRGVFAAATNDKIDGASHTFQFKATTPAQAGAQLTPAAGGTINEALGTSAAPTSGQLMDLTTKLTTAERVYDMQFVTTYPNTETDVFDFKVHFVNPFEIKLATPADFQLIDKVNGTADTQDVKGNYIVTFNGKNIVTKGVAETADSPTTVKASDYVNLSDANYGLFYELTPSTEYFTISKAGGNAFNKESVLTWLNSGTKLIKEQTVGSLKVKFVTSFAEITKTADNITVKPE